MLVCSVWDCAGSTVRYFVSVLNCRFWLMLMVKFRLCSLITFDRSTFNILLCAFSRLSVAGCGSEWHRGDRERLAVDQQSQARGGEPGQAVAGARNGNPGRKFPFFCFLPVLRCLRPVCCLRFKSPKGECQWLIRLRDQSVFTWQPLTGCGYSETSWQMVSGGRWQSQWELYRVSMWRLLDAAVVSSVHVRVWHTSHQAAVKMLNTK